MNPNDNTAPSEQPIVQEPAPMPEAAPAQPVPPVAAVETPAPTGPSLPPIDELMNSTWARFKERLWPLAVLAALPMVVAGILGLIVVGIVKIFPSLVVWEEGMRAPEVQPALMGIVAVMILIAAVAYVWSTLSLFTMASNPVQLPIKQALLDVRSKILPFIGVMLLSILIVGGAGVFFFIPAIIFGVMFSFWVLTFLLEGERGMNALLKSREYVRGYWWKTVGYIALLVVISAVFGFVFDVIKKIATPVGELLRLAFQIIFPGFSAVYLSLLFSRYQEVKKGITVSQKGKWLYLSIGIIGALIVAGLGIGTLSFITHNRELLQLMMMRRG